MTRNEENLCQFFKYVLIQRLNNIFLKNNPLFPNISTYAQLLEENIIKKKKSHQECIKFHIVKTYKRFVIWGGGGGGELLYTYKTKTKHIIQLKIQLKAKCYTTREQRRKDTR